MYFLDCMLKIVFGCLKNVRYIKNVMNIKLNVNGIYLKSIWNKEKLSSAVKVPNLQKQNIEYISAQNWKYYKEISSKTN